MRNKLLGISLGLCAGISAYSMSDIFMNQLMHKTERGCIVNMGCTIISAFCGEQVFIAIRDEVNRIQECLDSNANSAESDDILEEADEGFLQKINQILRKSEQRGMSDG